MRDRFHHCGGLGLIQTSREAAGGIASIQGCGELDIDQDWREGQVDLVDGMRGYITRTEVLLKDKPSLSNSVPSDQFISE